ncbi:uncharacterized protein GGS22DRAFT_188968 [Annulohypoxylon maeteangense]|uniref:uncharacterized protein n=1 Tax=Annulohypoxylon maeteangense TaxID=1927788 RepID=UPI002007B032|nr:uncharacterized protein GGS22DRAFT_188968 [Annulohypoxylon maeteangense]KAI0884758.1 hypothetical protein GGS22DRAFT_188968 [Annulohypoxylon maeteangense]
MAPLDTDSQFKFLIACIKHSTAGKVDFNEVAKELSIITKGAAAKRYERLMKAHGISSPSSVKKESKDSKEGVKTRATPSKKRKLAAVDEDAGDVDEPIKKEIKGEVKTEDPIAVKAEQENSSSASTIAPGVTSVNGIAPTGQTNASPSTNAQNDEDDDDVLVICATEKRDDSSGLVYGGGHHHSHSHLHSHSHSHSPAPMIPGIHSFDYPANTAFPQQFPTPTTPATMSPNPLPYGFSPNTWIYPHHETHSYH